jgi:4-amino-4-deoxy-L-arabinose transferase-like glycosyltransferase
MHKLRSRKIDLTPWLQWLVPLALALLFLVFVFSFYPFREKLQYDTDEGLNVMSSMLVAKGYPLYSQVSRDQPPLFTHLLSTVFRVAGFSVNAARFLVLLFSTLLVWSCIQFLQLSWGTLPAILFAFLAVMIPRFLELSVSVMIGVPSIALGALVLLFVTLWHQKRHNLWLVLSGLALAASIMIKLFTGFLAPIILAGITMEAWFQNKQGTFSWKAILKPAVIWSLSFTILVVAIVLGLVGLQNLGNLVNAHLLAPSDPSFASQTFAINTHLEQAIPLLVLGVFGAVFVILRQRWLALYPLAWAVLAYGLLNLYSPAFYHHQLLVTIPAAILAAIGLSEGMRSITRIRLLSDLG